MRPHRLPERIESGDGPEPGGSDPNGWGLTLQVVIRRWQASDAEPMANLIIDSLDHLRPWMRWAQREPLSTEVRLRLFEKWDRYWESGEGAVYAIEVADELVGGCALHRRVGPGGIDVGYWLGANGAGRGIATRAAAALTQASFALDDIDFVQISHSSSNKASGAVAERLGFAKVDTEDHVTTWQRQRD